MIKARILDCCEFCDGELSTRKSRPLTAIDILGLSPSDVAALTLITEFCIDGL